MDGSHALPISTDGGGRGGWWTTLRCKKLWHKQKVSTRRALLRCETMRNHAKPLKSPGCHHLESMDLASFRLSRFESNLLTRILVRENSDSLGDSGPGTLAHPRLPRVKPVPVWRPCACPFQECMDVTLGWKASGVDGGIAKPGPHAQTKRFRKFNLPRSGVQSFILGQSGGNCVHLNRLI